MLVCSFLEGVENAQGDRLFYSFGSRLLAGVKGMNKLGRRVGFEALVRRTSQR